MSDGANLLFDLIGSYQLRLPRKGHPHYEDLIAEIEGAGLNPQWWISCPMGVVRLFSATHSVSLEDALSDHGDRLRSVLRLIATESRKFDDAELDPTVELDYGPIPAGHVPQCQRALATGDPDTCFDALGWVGDAELACLVQWWQVEYQAPVIYLARRLAVSVQRIDATDVARERLATYRAKLVYEPKQAWLDDWAAHTFAGAKPPAPTAWSDKLARKLASLVR